MVLEKSKSLLFSDSDSDDNESSSEEGPGASRKASPTLGGAQSIAAPTAVSKASLNDTAKESALGNAQVEAAMENAADSAAPSAGVASSEVSRADEEEQTPSPPARNSAVAAAADSKTLPADTAVSARPSAATPAGAPTVKAATAPVAAENDGAIIERSAAPWVSAQHPPSMATLAGSRTSLPAKTAAAGVGGVRRRPLTLGRPGMPPAKVTMPIAGGRAAWNKFLATTNEPEASTAAPSSLAVDGQDDKAGESAEGGDGEGDGDGELGEDTAAAAATAEKLAARGPRGFKNAADAQEGPNKGPAGAFSGNAMWRLAAGASSPGNRARSGVAANGHGGYSNPLAAMRAGGGTGATSGGGGAGGILGGDAMVNPLAGLRGAASMGGAGTANPLARGRGARPGGGGGIGNPMLRCAGGVGGIGGNSNPLARGGLNAGGGMGGNSNPLARGRSNTGGGMGGDHSPLARGRSNTGDGGGGSGGVLSSLAVTASRPSSLPPPPLKTERRSAGEGSSASPVRTSAVPPPGHTDTKSGVLLGGAAAVLTASAAVISVAPSARDCSGDTAAALVTAQDVAETAAGDYSAAAVAAPSAPSVGGEQSAEVGEALEGDGDGPAEFRAIGDTCRWRAGGMAPRMPRRAVHRIEEIPAPGKAKVGGLVVSVVHHLVIYFFHLWYL